MAKEPNNKTYDLAERTLEFAKRTRALVRRLPRTIANMEDIRQLIRASGSVGANYCEACESLSRKDFALRIRISRKESKERAYWLQLLNTGNNKELDAERANLVREATELVKIFNAIVQKSR